MNMRKSQSDRLRETVVPGGGEQSIPAASASPPRRGTTLKLPIQLGEFVGKQLLARGGMSVMLIGHAVGNPRDRIAMKIPVSQDPVTFARFNDEASLLRGLNHPSIVRFRKSGESDLQIGSDGTATRKLPWLAMDYIAGQSLRQRIKTEGTIPWPDVRKLLEDIVSALDYLHGKHLCHRDVKPDNIIFHPGKKRWILVDFGIAKALSANPRLTVTLAVQGAGSWDYMSPEQLDGKPVDTRTDIYSLGKTAWEALIGTVPRVGTPFPSVAAPQRKVPAEVDALIAKMVAHRPEDRYSSPKEVAEALTVGELRIARQRRLRTATRKAMRWVSVSIFIILTACGGWLTGDYIVTKRARDLYVRTKESATSALRQLELCRNSYQYRFFFWGRRYIDAKLDELRPAAEVHRAQMTREYNSLIKDLERVDRDDEYKAARAQIFASKYQEDFRETNEWREVTQRAIDLGERVREKKENAEATNAIAKANEHVNAGRVKLALDLLDDFLKTSSNVTRQRVQARRGEILDLCIADRLSSVDQTAKPDNPTSLIKAEADLKDLVAEVGMTTAEIKKRLSNYDRKLWKYYRARASEACTREKYNEARAFAEQYKNVSRVGYHIADAADFMVRVNSEEDDTDWRIASQSARQNTQQKAFPLAFQDIRAYHKKWPAGRHRDKMKTMEDEIVAAHFVYLRSFDDIDVFNEAFAVFRELHEHEQDTIVALRRHLCWIAHSSIITIVADTRLEKSVKITRLNDLEFKQCEQEKAVYLNDLLNRAIGYLNNANRPEWMWYYLWAVQRPPGDCVTMGEEPTIYEISISRIEIGLDGSYYEELKGWNNANPHIHIGMGSGSGSNYRPIADLLDTDGPVNTQRFDIQGPNTFWIDTKAVEKLWIRVTDGDCGPTGACQQRFATIPGWRLAQSGQGFDVSCDEGLSVNASWSSR